MQWEGSGVRRLFVERMSEKQTEGDRMQEMYGTFQNMGTEKNLDTNPNKQQQQKEEEEKEE